ncbi:MAG TPA: VOC family protein [Pseudomonadales bacterium]|nr:VOC family protein [Pseudomonadales bacterium]
MNSARLEHVNVTVTDPQRTADLLCGLFGWHVRWAGPSQMGGNTVHVGNDDCYLALYTPGATRPFDGSAQAAAGGLNHVAVVVDDLDATAARIHDAGIETFNHAAYEPGRRFYFRDPDGVEYEVVSYA